MTSRVGKVMTFPKGEYDPTTTYTKLDLVSFRGSSYLAKDTTVGNDPTDTDYWQPYVDISGKMDKSVYDTDVDGMVDNTEKVNNHTVESDVPADAVFTDTDSFSDLLDVNITNPVGGDIVVYDGQDDEWKNETVNLSNSLSMLSDVDISNPGDGDYLKYNEANRKWENVSSFTFATWADGTDEQIAAMLDAHYNGDIDIYDYWSVGDERIVSLSAMSATGGVGESHPAQNISLVLMNKGGKTLTTPVNGITECAFIVGQKGCLGVNLNQSEYGYMNSSTSNHWPYSDRRNWCNNVYRMALPESLRSIFKEFYHADLGSTVKEYFSLATVKEITNNLPSSTSSERLLTQFKYYETSANRKKQYCTTTGNYWTRSKSDSDGISFYRIDYNGSQRAYSSDNKFGISPYGVI